MLSQSWGLVFVPNELYLYNFMYQLVQERFSEIIFHLLYLFLNLLNECKYSINILSNIIYYIISCSFKMWMNCSFSRISFSCFTFPWWPRICFTFPVSTLFLVSYLKNFFCTYNNFSEMTLSWYRLDSTLNSGFFNCCY